MLHINQDYTLELVNKRDIPCKRYLIEDIRKHYSDNSLNCKTTNCYAFGFVPISTKHLDNSISTKVDFCGGQDWSKSLVDYDAQYIMMNETKKCFKVIYK